MDTVKKIFKVIVCIVIILASGWIISTSATVLIGHIQKSRKLSNTTDFVSMVFCHDKHIFINPCKLPPECTISGIPSKEDLNALEEFSKKLAWPCDVYRLLVIWVTSIFFYRFCRKLVDKLLSALTEFNSQVQL